MTEQAEGAGCTVVVLAPHQGDGATLCRLPSAIGPEAACALPTVAVSAEPDIEEVIREVSRLVGEPVTLLRANAAAWDSGFATTAALIAEIGPLSAEPDGFCWALLNDRDIETIDPAWARASMRSWTHERMAGWSGPGSRAAGLAMAVKLIEAAQDRWRAVHAPHLAALARAGAVVRGGVLIERPAPAAA